MARSGLSAGLGPPHSEIPRTVVRLRDICRECGALALRNRLSKTKSTVLLSLAAAT